MSDVKVKTNFLSVEPMGDRDPFGRKSQDFAGRDIFGSDGLMKETSLSRMWLLAVFEGVMPTKQQEDIFDALSVALTHHGPCHSATFAARNTGAIGATIPSMMITAVAVQSARAREVRLAMEMLQKGVTFGVDEWGDIFCIPPEPGPYKLTTEVTYPSLEHVPGFRIQGKGCATEIIVIQTLDYLTSIENDGVLMWLKENRKALEEFVGFPIDMILVAAAAFVDLGVTQEHAEALYLHVFSFGATVSAIEARQMRHINQPLRQVNHVSMPDELEEVLVQQDKEAQRLRDSGKNGLLAYTGSWSTSNVWIPNHEHPEDAQALTHGTNTLEMFGKKTWMELAIYGVSGKWPERSGGDISLLETLSLGLAYPAVNIWPNCTAAICGSERVDPTMMAIAMTAAYNATILGHGPRVSTARTLQHLHSLTKNLSLEEKKRVLRQEIQKVNKFMPGFGRPAPPRDERVIAFLRVMEEQGMEQGLYLQLAFLVEEVFLEDKEKMKFGHPGLNTSGFMAATLLDLGLSSEVFMDYLIPSFFAGAVVPYTEALRRPEGVFFPIPLTAVECVYNKG